jgi:hypothetical protein
VSFVGWVSAERVTHQFRKRWVTAFGLTHPTTLESRADAEKVYTAEWRAMIAQRYGAEPEITFFESPVIVDNETHQVQVAAE